VRLILATRNEHKRAEFARLLGDAHTIETLPDEVELPPETGSTFVENARVKALTAAQATGVAAIADDSGIEADALGGAPGVRSARYAGEGASDEANLAKLRAEAPPGSGLAYVCALVYADPSGTEQVFEGRCAGTMSGEERGSNGFGYDPVFLPAERDDGLTMAELDPAAKDAISHRGRAVAELRAWLPG
jgi:XTP/dITP diphosphohydrolase